MVRNNTFYDLCCFWFIAVNIVDKVLFLDIDDMYHRPICVCMCWRLLFWSDWSGVNAKIEQAYLDGTNRKAIIDTDLGFSSLLYGCLDRQICCLNVLDSWHFT